MKTEITTTLIAVIIILTACSKSPVEKKGDSGNPDDAKAPAPKSAQVYTDKRLQESIKKVFIDGHDEAFRDTKAFLAYTDEAKAFKKETTAKILTVLSFAASDAPSDSTFSIHDIVPPTKEPEATIVVNETYLEEQRKGVLMSGGFSAGAMSGEYIGMLRHPSGMLSKSLKVARGLYYSQLSIAPTQNIKAFVTVLCVVTSQTGAVIDPNAPLKELASRKHLFQSLLPDESLIFDQNQQLQFPVGAGSRYRFIGASAECFNGFVFFGSDSAFPLTFVLLPDRGLTYIHGKGSIWKGTKLATFPLEYEYPPVK